MKVLLTGAAGFIGFHVSKALLERGDEVVGIDNLNHYYDVRLKQARLEQLEKYERFDFRQVDICNITDELGDIDYDTIAHLAAQAGVRYSLENPFEYIRSNVLGHTWMMEFARRQQKLKHFVYASSSSVYGHNQKVPFSEGDRTDSPASLYAATKKADELISHCYSTLYDIPMTGLRFFTVYGPWGRPDMAVWMFTKAIIEDRPIVLYNRGQMWRDFTYIDDIVAGTIAAIDTPYAAHTVHNLGNNRPEMIGDLVAAIEAAVGKKATIGYEDMQAGDVERTYADTSSAGRLLGYHPKTLMMDGVAKFVEWYKEWSKNGKA